MLFNKISENPRKGFLKLLVQRMNKIKETNIFSNPTSLKLSFAPGHGIFHTLFILKRFAVESKTAKQNKIKMPDVENHNKPFLETILINYI